MCVHVCVCLCVCVCVCERERDRERQREKEREREGVSQYASPCVRGRTYAKKVHFLRKKRAGYANLKMLCVYCTQKTVTSHIKMRLAFSFFAPSRECL